MDKDLKLFLDYGIYNNNLYFPNTLKKTKEYIEYLNPIIEKISNSNKKEILSYLKENNTNIYSLSICIGAMKLNSENYLLLEKKIQNHKELFVFLWIYTSINSIIKDKYINKLYINKINIIENNIPDLFNLYKPSCKVILDINKKLKEKYKVKYMIESQENLDNLLEKIKYYNITPSDINVEMGFTFDNKIKNQILEYFLENFDIVDLIYKIDKWFIEAIPLEILDKIRIELDKLSSVSNIYDLLVINTGLKHIELTNIINEQIKLLNNTENVNKLNVNYMPNMKINNRWDRIHTYNSYISGIISILNENFDSIVCLKEKNISSNNTFDLYNTLNNNTSFSLDKASKIQKSNVPSLLFSDTYSDGYDILWDITTENCPLYKENDYLLITGKNTFLIECVIDYINNVNDKKEEVIKKNVNKEEEVKKETQLENTNSVKFNIRKK